MAKGAYGAWPIDDWPLEELRNTAVAVLEREGFRVTRRSANDERMRVAGLRGSKWMAYLGQILPFGPLLGVGSRVRATVVAGRSLDDGATGLRLSIRCAPIEEGDSLEEDWYYRDHGERAGDHRKVTAMLRRLVAGFRREGIL